jgi:hypothetical protein
MNVRTAVKQEIAASCPRVFDVATDLETLARVFVGYGPIPAIRRVEVVGGGAHEVGALRKVTLSDGAVLDEEVVALRRPDLHAYHIVDGFKLPFSLLVRRAESEWRFQPLSATRTRISWRYSVRLTTPLVLPVSFLILRLFMRKAMARCLRNLKAEIEPA